MKTILLYRYYFLAFLFIGTLVYSPMLFNGFVWDDYIEIINNYQIHQLNLTIFFDNIFNSGPFYRQIIIIYNTLLYAIFGQNAFPYHLIQLILHILVTSLLFLLLRNYFSKTTAFILSLLFLIHPINAESVLWISAAKNQLFTISGLAALLLIHKKQLKQKDYWLLALCLLFSLLTYEMGLFFLAITIVYAFFKKRTEFKYIFIVGLLTLFLYISMRILGNAEIVPELKNISSQPSFMQKLYTMPTIYLYYLKTLIFPQHLAIWQYWYIEKATFTAFIMPALLLQLLFFVYLWLSTKIKKQNKRDYTFFSIWFFMGFITIGLPFHIEMTVADRWFTFAFIGALGIIGYYYNLLAVRLKKYKLFFLCFVIVILCLLATRTFIRSFDWKDNKTLYTHDLTAQPNNMFLNYELGIYYLNTNKYNDAIVYFKKVAETTPDYAYTLINLGNSYMKAEQCEKAIPIYRRVFAETKYKLNKIMFDEDLAVANCYLQVQRYEEVITLLSKIKPEQSFYYHDMVYFRALAYYHLEKYELAAEELKYLEGVTYQQRIIDLEKKVYAALENKK